MTDFDFVISWNHKVYVKASLDGVLLHICFCAYVLSIPSKLKFLLLCFSTSAKHTE